MSRKLDPKHKIKPAPVALSDLQREEVLHYLEVVHKGGKTFSQYVRELIAKDEANRSKAIHGRGMPPSKYPKSKAIAKEKKV